VIKNPFWDVFQQASTGRLSVITAASAIILMLSFTLTAAQPPLAADRRASAPVFGYRVINVYPHDRQSFTQGLIHCDGFLYESTGLRGKSLLRKVDLETGAPVKQHRLAWEHFGEGLTDWGEELIQLTWRSNLGFVYDKATLRFKGSFRYPGEGWGLTHDASRLIMSDGSATLRFLEPETFRETGRLTVQEGGLPLESLNELEFVEGEIYANVWETDRIVKISPQTGRVTGWIDLHGLLPGSDRLLRVDVLNGIAYDARAKRLFVTGKLWPKLFEIELVAR